MNRSTKNIIITAALCVLLTSGAWIAITRFVPSNIPDSTDYIVIKRSEVPTIIYPQVVYPSEEYKPFTQEQKDQLYTNGIKPFIDQMAKNNYIAVTIEVSGFPTQQTITLHAVLYNNETKIFWSYGVSLIKKADGTYDFIGDAPPGYAG